MIIKTPQLVTKRLILILIYQGISLNNKSNKRVFTNLIHKIKIKNIMRKKDRVHNRWVNNKKIRTQSNKSNHNHFSCRV